MVTLLSIFDYFSFSVRVLLKKQAFQRSGLLVFFVISLLVTNSPDVLGEVRIGTWNLQHLGSKSGKDIGKIAEVAKGLDFLAIQEVMAVRGVENLTNELERLTNTRWSFMTSSPVGSQSYKEMYGFIWRDDSVSYSGRAVQYIDYDNIYEREPFSASFRSVKDNTKFVIATVHVRFGKSVAERNREVASLGDYWQWLGDVYEDEKNIILMGDFNLPPSSRAWTALRQHARPLVVSGGSTLSTKDGKYANLYDNAFVSKYSGSEITEVGVFNYPKYLNVTHKYARKVISDHAPVFFSIDF